MTITEHRGLFIAATLGLILIAASPSVALLIKVPDSSQKFSELWLLGPEHKAKNYPFNISAGEVYGVFLEIANHLEHSAYYVVEVKLRNQSQTGPDSFNRTASTLPALFNITAFVPDASTWEIPVTFSLSYRYNETLSRVEVQSLNLNNVTLVTGGYTSEWDPKGKGFLSQLFFELWLYDAATQAFEYNNQCVGLWLNMTR